MSLNSDTATYILETAAIGLASIFALLIICVALPPFIVGYVVRKVFRVS